MTTITETAAIPVFKSVLKSSDDNALLMFLHGYALGFAADHFIGGMSEPNQRIEFLIAIAKTYPDDWKQVVTLLEKGR